MLKNIFKIIAVFVIGIAGGVFADQILWPYFVERPLFYQYRLEQGPVYLTEKKEITIQENVALRNAVELVEKAVVGIMTETKKGKISEGSGLVVTSDGLIITLAELLPKGSTSTVFIGQKLIDGKILKRDSKENLALIKIEEKNLKTCSFADLGKIKLGERVFLLGLTVSSIETDFPQKLVNEGIIKTFDKNFLQTNISEKKELSGSPLFNIEGQAVGLSTIDKTGEVSAIPISKIKEFIGF